MTWPSDDCGRLTVVAFARADQHEGPVGGKGEFGQSAGKAGTGLDQRNEAARRYIDALEHAFEVVPDFAHQPVTIVLAEKRVVIQHRQRVAFGAQQDDTDSGFIGAQMQNGVFQFARDGERPEIVAECVGGFD